MAWRIQHARAVTAAGWVRWAGTDAEPAAPRRGRPAREPAAPGLADAPPVFTVALAHTVTVSRPRPLVIILALPVALPVAQPPPVAVFAVV